MLGVVVACLASAATAELTSNEVWAAILTDYDSRLSPAQATGNSTQLLCLALELSAVFGFVEDSNEYRLTQGWVVQWTDERLAFASLSSLTFLGPAERAAIWTPHLVLNNLMQTYATLLDQVIVYANGTVVWYWKVSTALGCHYDFEVMPFDTQDCYVEVVNVDSLPTVFELQTIQLNSHIDLPEWEITDSAIAAAEFYSLGQQHSGVRAQLSVKRRQAYSMSFVVTPGFLVVALAYASFWIDYRAAPSRTTLAVITTLTSLTQLFSAFNDFPKIGYNTWLLQFLYINLVFAAFAMVEYVVVNRLHVHEERKIAEGRTNRKLHTIRIMQVAPASDDNGPEESVVYSGQGSQLKRWFCRVVQSPPQLVDGLCRILYPMVYSSLMINLFNQA